MSTKTKWKSNTNCYATEQTSWSRENICMRLPIDKWKISFLLFCLYSLIWMGGGGPKMTLIYFIRTFYLNAHGSLLISHKLREYTVPLQYRQNYSIHTFCATRAFIKPLKCTEILKKIVLKIQWKTRCRRRRSEWRDTHSVPFINWKAFNRTMCFSYNMVFSLCVPSWYTDREIVYTISLAHSLAIANAYAFV